MVVVVVVGDHTVIIPQSRHPRLGNGAMCIYRMGLSSFFRLFGNSLMDTYRAEPPRSV